MSSWRLVIGRNRCSKCGELVDAAWLAYTSPTTWTLAVCEPCASALIERKDP